MKSAFWRYMPESIAYPASRRTVDFDDYHGTRVMDPYRWLERMADPEVVEWTRLQNRLTSEVLSDCPGQDRITARLREMWSYPRSSLPRRFGRRIFTLETAPLQNQPVLCMSSDDAENTRVELLNPNEFAPDGTIALTGWSVSRDGRHIAYALSHDGSDRQEIRIRDIDSGTDYPEVIHWSKSEEDLPFPNVAWHPDGRGFYYPRLPDPATITPEDEYRYCQVYFHRLGEAQSDDLLVFERQDDPDLNFVPIVTDDGRYLVLHIWKGLLHKHQVCFRPISESGEFSYVLPAADARYVFLGNAEDRFFFHTNASAPRGRIIGVDLSGPQKSAWHEVVPQMADPIASAALLDHLLVIVTVCGGHHRVCLFDHTGLPGPEIVLPGNGSVSDVALDDRNGQLLIAYESILEPTATLRYDLATGALISRQAPPVSVGARTWVERQCFAEARDGTQLPMTIVHASDTRLDGSNPALLYGYGGFNVNITPNFDPSRLLWLENGGIYAFVNLRGGGEFGEDWHAAGMLQHKQTVFDDFTAAAEWLIDSGYTSSSRLAIRGESNGGLLVAACMLQRPELFCAVVCSIPVTDMLRYRKFTIGRYWEWEYGDPEADRGQFAALYAYSPLHNVRKGVSYPAILLTTGANDDRVVPAHAMKLAAQLQGCAEPGSPPQLLRVQTNVGHGLGRPTAKTLELDGDILTFLMTACRMAAVQ
jgi:prolyl oligopeptidase